MPDTKLVKKTPQQQSTDQLKPKVRKFSWLGVFSVFLAGLAGIVAGRLGYVWPEFDAVSHLSLHFVFLSFSFFVAMFVPRMKMLAGTVLMICCVTMLGAWSFFGTSVRPGAEVLLPNEKLVRVVHYNTRKRNTDNAAVEAEILKLDPDVAVLLEFAADKLPILQRIKSRYPYVYTCAGIGKCEVAIISKTPITVPQNMPKTEEPPYAAVTLGKDFGRLTIVGVHTQRIPNMTRHFDHARGIAAVMETVAAPIVLTGDFNATPFSRILAIVEEGTGFERVTSLPTWPAHIGLPQFAIDHVFLGPGVRLIDGAAAGEAGGSDHLPIVVNLAVQIGNRN